MSESLTAHHAVIALRMTPAIACFLSERGKRLDTALALAQSRHRC